ncbi:MAG: hypothetical protein EXS31_12695 [Pedosphaera sp.]|nr:hypothetical protein [Pedosphaera sp.]
MNFFRHLSFTAPPEAMTELITRAAFQPSSIESASQAPTGPHGWRSADKLGPEARAYFRAHRASRNGRGLPIGRNRSWSEILLVDGSGTNGFFTLWAID